MAVKQFLFTYDDVEHKEIDQFLNSIPSRQKSKYVRIAIQEYLSNVNNPGEKITDHKVVKKLPNTENKVVNETEELIEIDSSILNLGL